MKSRIILFIIVLAIIAIPQYSCNKSSEELANNNSSKEVIIRKTAGYNENPTYTVTWSDNSSAVFYESLTIADEFEIKLYDASSNYLQTVKGAYEGANNYVRIRNFVTNTVLYEHPYTNPNTNHVNGYPGNCALLGARKSGESYSDCYERNWDNFCCDFTGCITQSTQPQWVAVAIAISCAFKDGKITVIYDNVNEEILYD